MKNLATLQNVIGAVLLTAIAFLSTLPAHTCQDDNQEAACQNHAQAMRTLKEAHEDHTQATLAREAAYKAQAETTERLQIARAELAQIREALAALDTQTQTQTATDK